MERRLRMIKKFRYYSEDFKRSIVDDFESGSYSVYQLGRLHSIYPQLIYKWIYKYSTMNKKGYRIVEKENSSEEKLKALQKRISELERVLGQKQLKLDFTEKMIELAEEELGIDLKKNFSTPPLDGSDLTPKQ